MPTTIRQLLAVAAALFCTALPFSAAAQASAPKIGIVIMHGKGGSPNRHVTDLANDLERRGYLVANLEMPWSGRRNYDVPITAAEDEVVAALQSMRSKGAQKLFVAGHSQGGLFALYFAGKHEVDGIIAIAPGGDVGNRVFREKLGESVEQARKLVAAGKGGEHARLSDYEGSKGVYTIVTPPAAYLTWFDPEGAFAQTRIMRALKPQIPVLLIVPRNDYPGLLMNKQRLVGALPANALNKLYEPDASHLGAPAASREEIARWTSEVASVKN
jgi:pimeloyl-ACP methyl ester carboxylesterase